MFAGKPKQRLRVSELVFTYLRYCCVWVKCISMVYKVFITSPRSNLDDESSLLHKLND